MAPTKAAMSAGYPEQRIARKCMSMGKGEDKHGHGVFRDLYKNFETSLLLLGQRA